MFTLQTAEGSSISASHPLSTAYPLQAAGSWSLFPFLQGCEKVYTSGN